MITKNLITALGILILAQFTILQAQPNDKSEVKWHSMDSVSKWQGIQPKPILIFFTENGNDSVTKMESTTLLNPGIASYLNSRFYCVKFDITSDKPARFLNGKVYVKKAGEKYHDLPNTLLGKHPAAPAYVFYSLAGSGQAFYGYKNSYEFRCLLTYVFEEVNKTSSFEEWNAAYEDAYPPDGSLKKIDMKVKWVTLENALSANDTDKKGIFLFWLTRWSSSSNVFLSNSIENDSNSMYLNENFHCVLLDAQTTDTLTWKGQKYINDGRDYKFHQMAISMLKGKMMFPALVFFGPDDKMVSMEQIYLPPDKFKLLLRYVNEGAYKEMALKEFLEKNNNGYIEIPLNLEFKQPK